MKIDQPGATIYAFPMLSKAASATEEAGSIPVAPAVIEATAAKEPLPLHRFLDAARRDLTEDEVASPAARRFLISELERLSARCAVLEGVERRHNDLRVEHAKLEERATRSRRSNLLADAGLLASSLALGAAPGFLVVPGAEKIGAVVTLGAALLVVACIVAKVRE